MAQTNETLQVTIEAIDKASNVFTTVATGAGAAGKATSQAFSAQTFGNIGMNLLRAGEAAVGVLDEVAGAASDVQEATNFATQIFKNQAQDIVDWAGRSTASILMSKNEAIQMASQFGAFGITMGLTGAKVATFAEGLVKLSADIASLRNTSVEDAATAIEQALRGRYTAISKYGVILNDAIIKQAAFNAGVYDGTGRIDAHARMMIVNNELFRQMAIAQGDVERTSGLMANQSRLAEAQFENLKAAIGVGVTPALSSFLGTANDVMSWFNGLPVPVQKATGELLTAGTTALLAGGGIAFMASKAISAVQGLQAMVGMLEAASVAEEGFAAAAAGAALAVAPVAAVIGLTVAAGVAMNIVFSNANNNIEEQRQAMLEYADAVNTSGVAFGKFTTQQQDFNKLVKTASDNHSWFDALKAQVTNFDAFKESFTDMMATGDETVSFTLAGESITKSLSDINSQFDTMSKSAGPTVMSNFIEQWRLLARGMQATDPEKAREILKITDKYANSLSDQINAQATANLLKEQDIKTTTGLTSVGILQQQQMAETTKELDRISTAYEEMATKQQTATRESEAFKQALGEWNNLMFSADDATAAWEQGLADLSVAIGKNGKSLDLHTQKGRDNFKQVESLSKTVGEELLGAYESSGHSMEAVQAKAEALRVEFGSQQKQLGLNNTEMQTYLTKLGLTPAQVTTLIKLSQQDLAFKELSLLKINLDKLSEPVQMEVTAALDSGDYVRALAVIKREANVGIVYPIVLTPTVNTRYLPPGITFPTIYGSSHQAAAPSGGDGASAGTLGATSGPAALPGTNSGAGGMGGITVPIPVSVGGGPATIVNDHTTVNIYTPVGMSPQGVVDALRRYDKWNGLL